MTPGLVIKLSAFLAGSAGLAILSRASLRQPGSHGFYRFFAWECLLTLFLLNVGNWFHNPFSPAQIIAWSLLLISAFLVLHAAQILRIYGRPDSRRQDETLLGIERTTRLVTQGAYGFIRHPLYSSLLFLGWGVFFKDPTWLAGSLAAGATSLLWATARADEMECLQYFGEAYQEYMQRTKMFIPYLF